MSLQITNAARLDGQEAPEIFLSQPLWSWALYTFPSFLE